MTFPRTQPVEHHPLPSRKRASRSRTALRMFVTAATLIATAPAAFARITLVPAPGPVHEHVHEHVPSPRSGYMWRQGYWAWAHGRYVWVPGDWTVQAPVGYGVYPGQMPPAPAPEPPPPPHVERLSADALFPFGRGDINDIRPAGPSDLAQIAARLRALPFDHVEIRGYTDRLGSDGYNLDLSRRRAEAVKAVLVQQGVRADKSAPIG